MPKESESKSSESQGGRGRGGYGASSASNASSPSSSSDKGGRVGTGGFGQSSAESTGGRGRGGFSASSAGNASTATGDRVGTGSYGSASAESQGGRGRGGTSAVGGLSAASGQSIGGRGRGGFAASSAPGYSSMQDAQRSMLSQGVTGLNGAMVKAEPSYRETEVRSMNQYNAIQNALGTIKAAEARKTDPYNGLVHGINTPTHANLTGMTIADVQAYQKDMQKRGHATTAVGAYQMLAGTLASAVKKAGFDPTTTKFTKSVQDQLAMGLIDERAQRATVNGVIDQDKFAAELAKEWAGFATKTGKSHYAGVGDNAATVGYDRVASVAGDLLGTGMAGPASKTTQTSTTMVAANEPATPKTSFHEKYLGVTPADKPVQVAETAKPAKRSMGKTIAGIGLDVGMGLIPGIGMGASVVNAGLTLAGKPTIGQSMVDGMGNPVHIGADASGYETAGGGGSTGGKTRTQETVVAQADPVDDFGSKYLGWSDPTQRPTPSEKYGVNDYAAKEYGS